MTSIAKKKTSNDYKKALVLCVCQFCWEGSGGQGRMIPRYTWKRHSKDFPRTKTTPPTNLDSRYLTQPFGRPARERNASAHTATAAGTLTRPQESSQELSIEAAGPQTPANGSHETTAGLGSGNESDDSVDGVIEEFLHDFSSTLEQDEMLLDNECALADFDMDDWQSEHANSALEDTDSEMPASDALRLSDSVPAAYAHPSYFFDARDPPPRPQDVLHKADVNWFWRIILLLVAWLHLTYHTLHRACNLILTTLKFIFSQLDVFIPGSTPLVSLSSTFRRLNLTDSFLIMPMCPECRRIVPHDSPEDTLCPSCSVPLFKTNSTNSRYYGLHSDYEDINNEDAKVILKFPFQPISRLLSELLNREGIEEQIDAWRTLERKDGELRDIMDGKIWQTLPGPDGKPFFDNDPDRESKEQLRIGITLGFDGFGYQHSRNAGTHSSDVLSCCIANFPIQLKCLTRNLLLVAIFPGPKAPDGAETQYILVPFTDDLIKLFEDGIWVKTYLYPEGRLIYLALVAVCCDHPALCRVCGFADHNHASRFCTKCTIRREELRTEGGLKNGFEPRTGEEHRRLAFQHKEATTEEQTALFDEHGTRYTELVRLRYFDPVRMTVIDPMHNILLGIMKAQWHDAWIKTKALRQRTSPKKVARELDLLNAYLKEFEMPSWVGRLPSEVGYPAAGSLSADEYKALGLVYLPVIIPFVWAEWQPHAQQEFEKKLAAWQTTENTRKRRIEKGKNVKKSDENPAPMPVLRMHADDSNNFLKLAAFLKITLARSIRTADLQRAQQLLDEYLQDYLRIHPDQVKPNFHWVTHIFDQIRDYGPVYGFWSFTYERLNKTLKSYKTNNHGGGEIETSFMRAFARDAKLRELVKSLAGAEDTGNDMRETAELMLQTDSDNRGTVAAVAQELDEVTRDVGKRLGLGRGTIATLDNSLQKSLLMFYRENDPDACVCARNARLDEDEIRMANFLRDKAIFRKYIVLNGRRIMPCSDVYRAPNSLIQTRFANSVYVGQVIHILTHTQPRIEKSATLLHVCWFKPLWPGIFDTSVWDQFPELEVGFFEFDSYLDPASSGPPALIPPEDVASQACCVRMVHRPPRKEDGDKDELSDEDPDCLKIWVTVGLTKDTIVI